jgi:hypothetical protein
MVYDVVIKVNERMIIKVNHLSSRLITNTCPWILEGGVYIFSATTDKLTQQCSCLAMAICMLLSSFGWLHHRAVPYATFCAALPSCADLLVSTGRDLLAILTSIR